MWIGSCCCAVPGNDTARGAPASRLSLASRSATPADRTGRLLTSSAHRRPKIGGNNQVSINMAKPAWLANYPGGDTTAAHALNLARTETYINAVKQDGRGLPADPSRPGEIYWKQVSEEFWRQA